jgi:subtilisin family serine protease
VDIGALTPEGTVWESSGTSNSTALVAGVVALIRARYPDASADEVVTRLLATVEDLAEPGRDDATGYGMVRPYEALTATVPPDAPNPVYEGLDLTDTADPGPGPPALEQPEPPSLPEPPTEATGGDSGAVLLLVPLAAVGLAFLAGCATLVVVLLARRRSRTRPPAR